MKKLTFVLLSFVIILIIGCDNKKNKSFSNDIEKIKILRYENELHNIDTANFAEGIKNIASTFNVFIGDEYNNSDFINELNAFVASKTFKETYNAVNNRYNNSDWVHLNNKLKEYFNNYKKAFSTDSIPLIYTYISGYDFHAPIKYNKEALIISIDMYLGADYEPYKSLGIPNYISKRYTKTNICIDCFKEIAINTIPYKSDSYTLLDAIIEQGIILYFVKTIMPDEEDNNLLSFTPLQLKWCEQNESNLWSFIIQNELLFKTDAKYINMFMMDGPFTAAFSKESPAQIGAWLGFRIVSCFMKSNKDVTLKELIQINNPEQILEKSGYKPNK